MNPWNCWKKQEASQEKTEKINEKLDNIKEEIKEYFGSNIFSSQWLDNFLTKDFLLLGGFKYIMKYAICENCIHYIGPDAIQRKVYKISVLNAYCERHYGTIKPDFKCSDIILYPFYEHILELKANELGVYIYPPDPLFIKLGLDTYKPKYNKTHTRIPELWEYS
jgi:hypothetical protein